jgi:DNA recombination protein Rad52
VTLTPEAVERLNQPLNPARVHKREGGGGRQLSYLEAHDVIRAANDIFGIGGWSYQTRELVCLGEEPVQGRDINKQGFRIAYRAVVEVRVGDSCFADAGYGDAVEYTGSKLTPHELAAKEAVSDAVKRCLKNYGDQFGLCLYDKDAPEHRGGQRASGQTAAATTAATTPAADDGEFRFASGKYAGKTLREAPSSYLVWYLENGPREDVKDAIRAFSGIAAEPSPAAPADDDIPFDRTGDGGF